jgi:hypothetical protein
MQLYGIAPKPHSEESDDNLQTLASTPPMGWNTFGQDIADFKVELPLRVQPHETILLKIQG